MKSTTGRLSFTPEMGRRLRELRRAAGLSQTELAVRIGLERKSGKTVVSRLELGRLKQPSLGLVADFLKASGASFDAIAGHLGVKPAQQAEEKKPEPRPRRRPDADLTLEQKLTAVKRKAQQLYVRRMVEEMLHELVTDDAAPAGFEQKRLLAAYGRRVFASLERNHEARERMRSRLLEAKGISAGDADMVERAMKQTFKRMLESGDFERQPPVDALAVVEGRNHLVQVPRVEQRLVERTRMELTSYGRARYRVINAVTQEYRKLLMDAGMEEKEVGRYYTLVSEACATASENEPGSEGRERKRQEMIDRARSKERVAHLVDYAFRRWDELADKATGRPGNWPTG